MVWDVRVLSSLFFHIWTSRCYNIILWRAAFPPVELPWHLSEVIGRKCKGLFLGFLFCSVDLCLSLIVSLQMEGISPQILFSEIVFTVLDPFPYKFRICLSVSLTSLARTGDRDCTDSVDQFEENCHLNSIDLSNPWKQSVCQVSCNFSLMLFYGFQGANLALLLNYF